MENFDFERAKFLRKLGKDEKLFQQLIQYTETNSLGSLAKAITDPRNERELMVAESFYTYYSSRASLQRGIDYEDMEDGTLNDNYGVKVFIDLILGVKNGETDSYSFWNKMSPTDRARADYELSLANGFNPIGMAMYISRFIGESYTYLSAIKEFSEYLVKNDIRIVDPFEKLDIEDEGQVKNVVEFVTEFDRLVKNGKVSHKSDVSRFFQNIAGKIIK